MAHTRSCQESRCVGFRVGRGVGGGLGVVLLVVGCLNGNLGGVGLLLSRRRGGGGDLLSWNVGLGFVLGGMGWDGMGFVCCLFLSHYLVAVRHPVCVYWHCCRCVYAVFERRYRISRRCPEGLSLDRTSYSFLLCSQQ